MTTRDTKTGKFVKNNGRPVAKPMTRQAIAAMEDRELIANAITSRRELVSKAFDPRRNINDECGYPDSITISEYKELYDREGTATKVVNVLPEQSWQAQPTVFETEEPDDETEFERVWKELDKALQGPSWFQDEEGSPIWEQLERIDKLSGIGSFGVLLIGIDDGLELSQSVVGIDERGEQVGTTPQERKLLFLRSFDESQVKVAAYEQDKTNPRYGQPTAYNITIADPKDVASSGSAVAGLSLGQTKVHWTRVIHIADNKGSSEIFGVPRMKPVFNRLLDVRKLYGGSAEMYWKGAFPGLSIESHPQMGPNYPVDVAATRTQMQNYSNGLQRWLALGGLTVKSLAPQVVDPTPQINVQIENICIVLGIPKRIFTGSERGDLASSQDDSTWNDVLRHRQNSHITPSIIVPFVNRLILMGVLPIPEGFSVVWPDLEALTESEQATIAVQRTEAMAKYVQGNVENLITPIDYLTKFHGLTNEEAQAVIDATMAVLPDDQMTMRGEEEIRMEVEGEFADKEREDQFKQLQRSQ